MMNADVAIWPNFPGKRSAKADCDCGDLNPRKLLHLQPIPTHTYTNTPHISFSMLTSLQWKSKLMARCFREVDLLPRRTGGSSSARGRGTTRGGDRGSSGQPCCCGDCLRDSFASAECAAVGRKCGRGAGGAGRGSPWGRPHGSADTVVHQRRHRVGHAHAFGFSRAGRPSRPMLSRALQAPDPRSSRPPQPARPKKRRRRRTRAKPQKRSSSRPLLGSGRGTRRSSRPSTRKRRSSNSRWAFATTARGYSRTKPSSSSACYFFFLHVG